MTTTSVTREIRLTEAIQYLAYMGGDTEVILHLSQLRGVIFILSDRQRGTENERKLVTAKEAERKEPRN